MHAFPLVKWALSPISQLLVATDMWVPLTLPFNISCYAMWLSLLRSDIFLKNCLTASLSWQLAYYFLVPWKLHCRKDAFRSDSLELSKSYVQNVHSLVIGTHTQWAWMRGQDRGSVSHVICRKRFDVVVGSHQESQSQCRKQRVCHEGGWSSCSREGVGWAGTWAGSWLRALAVQGSSGSKLVHLRWIKKLLGAWFDSLILKIWTVQKGLAWLLLTDDIQICDAFHIKKRKTLSGSCSSEELKCGSQPQAAHNL